VQSRKLSTMEMTVAVNMLLFTQNGKLLLIHLTCRNPVPKSRESQRRKSRYAC
jgi:hypothetical protein